MATFHSNKNYIIYCPWKKNTIFFFRNIDFQALKLRYGHQCRRNSIWLAVGFFLSFVCLHILVVIMDDTFEAPKKRLVTTLTECECENVCFWMWKLNFKKIYSIMRLKCVKLFTQVFSKISHKLYIKYCYIKYTSKFRKNRTFFRTEIAFSIIKMWLFSG